MVPSCIFDGLTRERCIFNVINISELLILRMGMLVVSMGTVWGAYHKAHTMYFVQEADEMTVRFQMEIQKVIKCLFE